MKYVSNNLSLQENFRVKPLAFAILLAFSGNTQAATFNVTNTNDAGSGSLRQAVIDANVSVGADNITFAPALTGQTIVLTGAELSVGLIGGDLIISGSTPGDASSITINGGGNSRIIRSSSSNLTLENMTLTGGVSNDGGALYGYYGNFTLNDSVVTGNTATGDGGGIYSYKGSVTLNRSVVSGNSATGSSSEGGGIRVSYNVTLNDSTVSGNSTNGGVSSEGGGIHADDVTLNNSTVSGNSTRGTTSEGGGIYARGNVISISSTITGNSTVATDSFGGGVFVGGNLTLANSILSGNTGAGGNFAENGGGNNIATNSIFGDAPAELTTVTASITNNNNPMLGPLQNNGGPTPTHLPLAGSPALDAGNNAGAPANDQRGAGFPRIVNGTIDIGAVERQAVNPPSLGPTAVPIFSLGGLLAMISAFLGFGWRQRFLSRKRKE